MRDMDTLRNPSASRTEHLEAAKRLASSKDPAALDALCGALDTRDEELREAARSSLATLGGASVLARRAADRSVPEDARVLALTGLRYFRDDADLEGLIRLAKDPSAAIRAQATLALAVIGPTKVEAALVEALRDGDAKVRFYAADGLSSSTSAAAKQAVSKQLDSETDATVRFALITARNRQAPG
jgi:quinoprotein glucose dehydrogenase